MNSEILRTLDALANSVFVSSDVGTACSALSDTEEFYKTAVKVAEERFGRLHGEVGLLLIRLSTLYRSKRRWEDVMATEMRIAEIQSLYQHDIDN